MFDLPTIKLSNGLTVGNFNSPHSYKFEDGNLLQPVSVENFEERKFETTDNVSYHNALFRDVVTEDHLSLSVLMDLVFCAEQVDVLIVSRRMRMAALRQAEEFDLPALQSALVNNIRCIHRISWTPPICSIDTFAV